MQWVDEVGQLVYAKQLLRESQQTMSEDLHIVTLEAVAKARYGLQVTAAWIYRLYMQQDVTAMSMKDANELCSLARHVCNQGSFKLPRLVHSCQG